MAKYGFPNKNVIVAILICMFVIFIMNLVHQERQSVVEASQLLEFLPSVKFNDGDDYQDDDHEDYHDDQNSTRSYISKATLCGPSKPSHCVSLCMYHLVLRSLPFANIVLILVKLSF